MHECLGSFEAKAKQETSKCPGYAFISIEVDEPTTGKIKKFLREDVVGILGNKLILIIKVPCTCPYSNSNQPSDLIMCTDLNEETLGINGLPCVANNCGTRSMCQAYRNYMCLLDNADTIRITAT